MSLSAIPYAVDLTTLRQVLGSRSTSLHQVFGTHQSTDRAIALREMIDGEPLDEARGADYIGALEDLCQHLGIALPNYALAPFDHRLIDDVDAVLKARYPVLSKPSAIQVYRLLFGRAPIALPRPNLELFPDLGYWRADEVERIFKALKDQPFSSDNDDIDLFVSTIEGMVNIAASRSCAIVSFVY